MVIFYPIVCLTDRGVNKEIAIYSRQYGKTDYDELNRVQQEFISMIDIENGRPLLMIKCNISYETVIGYTAALKARIPVNSNGKTDYRKCSEL